MASAYRHSLFPYDRAVLTRRRIGAEVILVLALSLGQSAVYGLVEIVDLSTRAQSIGSQSTALNPSQSSREVFDFLYQFLENAFALAPVALVCWLLWRSVPVPTRVDGARSGGTPDDPIAPIAPLGRLGLDGRRIGGDALSGVGLALVVGACGLGVYLLGRALGITVAVSASPTSWLWWTPLMLLFSAFRSGAEEEVIMIGYLFARLRDLGWRDWAILAVSALVRSCYHLYQGWGSFAGNVLMGLFFGWLYAFGPRWLRGRTLPLLLAHFLIDAAVFLGYPWALSAWPALFGASG